MDASLIALSVVGFAISTYFTAVSYGWSRADARWVPAFCRLDDATCGSIVFTPQARLLGPPNSLLGQGYYAAILVGAPLGALSHQPWLMLYLGASLITVGLGIVLTYTLLFVTRVPCRLCFTSHAINAAIFVLLLLR